MSMANVSRPRSNLQESQRATYLDLDIGERPSSAVITLMGLGGSSFVERSDRPG